LNLDVVEHLQEFGAIKNQVLEFMSSLRLTRCSIKVVWKTFGARMSVSLECVCLVVSRHDTGEENSLAIFLFKNRLHQSDKWIALFQ
jgi:hypothetical protein